MTPEDRLKTYSAFAETDRKWATVMDAKAAFITVLNTALVSFLWTAVKIGDAQAFAHACGIAATLISLLSLGIALTSVLPRMNRQGRARPISFYGFVADAFPIEHFDRFQAEVDAMDVEAFAREALHQHLVISHVVQQKTDAVRHAGYAWLLAAFFMVAAVVFRG